MDDVLNDSIETSLTLNLYKNRHDSEAAHHNATLEIIPLQAFKNINNFNSDRLQRTAEKAYPKSNRPRGSNDIKSVKYLVSKIKSNNTKPIYLHKKGKKYTLLDGAHRVIAHHISNKQNISAYVVT
jgi:hypothetical protein